MGAKTSMLKDEVVDTANLDEIVHEDRRKTDFENAVEREKHSKKEERFPVWVKKSVLDYEKELKELQIELLKLQNHVKDKGLKVLMIFEGRDAAGKGGTIKRITEHLNPRGARIVALEKPSDVEKTQWYFQRYTEYLPSAGEMVLFDRSWYNRGGVEPVMGFCTPHEHQEFLDHVSEFEKMLVNSGIILFKFYFSVSKKEQARRFKARKTDPLKQFKLSPVDAKSQEMWDQYTTAKLTMLKASHTGTSPWVIIRSDNKKKARINCIKHILSSIQYPSKNQPDLKTSKKILAWGDEEIKLIESTIQPHINGDIKKG
ncbi:MAG: polyphosphate kinase 2 [Sulfuricurvum sp.]|uniref:polyphosphate kinase 2 n=1 Tax=Sulfuricurvum sp. TaxID=2025608 RepID=UPI0026378324|nr:polyphosphate kinase 2 [Sulfuricurvum sp.]MDD2830484.1 polyphosphate kinase 2 [Sulfuricurvum sp.]MDD4949949.1 polyphosphate kinase 2 [Sulfuricurvum sp.]